MAAPSSARIRVRLNSTQPSFTTHIATTTLPSTTRVSSSDPRRRMARHSCPHYGGTSAGITPAPAEDDVPSPGEN
ncbi:uncharacterized protein K489DRAFT_410788 [Dissoconium aciculare CBS 342.82]|uniref:Uncharacterized protein n=1 Tax=Dissoconium aciculare CBS 342.82 TaxID=1314786 RepID=A0A6J3M393_9PEZI|nr:uncharacterized protein K489DRAFT_410788 [Dissoconium aciculare CBS 342.82]KAF1822506.1 hypothetical protein K489DRAFT_410788 [Dissoconium aciculare CBS 342.82]